MMASSRKPDTIKNRYYSIVKKRIRQNKNPITSSPEVSGDSKRDVDAELSHEQL